MKTTKNPIPTSKRPDFPILMEGEATGNIYLMVNEDVGTVIWAGSTSMHKVGETLTDLKGHALAPFQGSVLLDNEG